MTSHPCLLVCVLVSHSPYITDSPPVTSQDPTACLSLADASLFERDSLLHLQSSGQGFEFSHLQPAWYWNNLKQLVVFQ